MYEYKCRVNRVIDGDSLDCSIDLGFGIMFNSKVRLYGIDTPESRTRDEDEKIRGLLAKININQSMIDNHLAVEYFGQSKEELEAGHMANRQILIDEKKINLDL